MYQFSTSSIALLQQCIELAKQSEENNPWQQRFSFTAHSNNLNIISVNLEETKTLRNQERSEEMHVDVEPTNTNTKYKLLEADPILNINLISEDPIDGQLLLRLAHNIPNTSAEKLCNHIFNNLINPKSIENLFKYFLPNYLRRQQSRLCLDVMMNAYKVYPTQFHILLQNLLNSELEASILQEFVSMLNPLEQNKILKMFVASDVSIDIFIRYIYTIHICFKNSVKDENIDNFVFVKLNDSSKICTAEKQYGRLLFTYLQNTKNHPNLNVLQDLVKNHRSAFRRPCFNLLNEILEKNN